jgi:hypothetical protein
LTPQQESALVIISQAINKQTAVQTAEAAKNDCELEIENAQGRVKFICNNSSSDSGDAEMAMLMEGMGRIMTYNANVEIAKHGFSFLKTFGLAAAGALVAVDNQHQWSSVARSGNKHWGVALTGVASTTTSNIIE